MTVCKSSINTFIAKHEVVGLGKLYSTTEERHKMMHALLVFGNGSLVGRESSGSLGIPSRISNSGRQMKTLHGDRERHRMKEASIRYVPSSDLTVKEL